MKVGMYLVGDGEVLLGKLNLLLVPGELGQGTLGALLRGIVIRVCDVGDGHTLGAVLLADPVGVGKVDADGGGGIAVTGKARCVDDLGADALDLGFLEAWVDG